MQLAATVFELREHPRNVFVLRNITHESLGAGKGQDQVFGFLLQPLVLISDRQLGACLMQSLCNGPRDAALIGDSKDDGHAAFETERH